jgi:MarR family transcriptional regulator for hemolysin
MSILKKLTTAGENRTTYRVGLLQSKAYRIMKQHTDKKLVPFEMSSTHWAFLGLLYDAKKGMRPGEIAEELGVEAPFVTRLLNEFTKKGFVKKTSDAKDSRATLLALTEKGRTQVATIEKHLRAEISPLIKDVSMGDLLSYLEVLRQIIENGTKNK